MELQRIPIPALIVLTPAKIAATGNPATVTLVAIPDAPVRTLMALLALDIHTSLSNFYHISYVLSPVVSSFWLNH